MRKIVRELHKQFPGVEIQVTGHKHYRLRFPGGLIITTSGTHPAASYGPSGQRQPATSHSELNRVSGAIGARLRLNETSQDTASGAVL